jgi:voltage-gated potassium channel
LITSLLATVRLFRMLGRALAEPATRGIVLLSGVILGGGTLFYMRVEGWSAVDALYFSVVTLATIGYGDLVPTSDASKLFTVVYSLIGIGVLASLIAALAISVRREADDQPRRRHFRPGTADDE